MTDEIRREAGETWRDAVIRLATPHGLKIECLEVFDEEIKKEDDPASAAWIALHEWNCLPVSAGR